ncbi:Glycosyl transferase, group 1 family protein [Hyella patelloides LEGE 07179]|uniref:Glycosyl transferase, group 1 family protein n=1 Tax=Hyella patelloides LEGE 07179 TaxID=945734 RepID=A0A563VJA1_9CYAN|nr:glycosyltransferase [Hyella patelloides]VEP11471.1 Glycosyl transferase, group 1 family protein [Hyella patelloides LEGE 07179]
MPKICITALEYPPDVGGVGESASRIAKMLIGLGYEVHVAVFRAIFRREKQEAEDGQFHRSYQETSQQDGVTVHRLHPAVRSLIGKEQDYLWDIYNQLKSLQQQYEFDLFHAFFINEMGFLTTMLAKECDRPVINSIRGADLHKHIFDSKQHGHICWTLANSDWTTFVSRDLMKRARVLVPEIKTRSTAFWNSINLIDFEQLPTPPLADRLQGTVISSVGNFRDKKGLEYLMDACGELDQETTITLLLVGNFVEKERIYWEQELASSGIADKIVITGKISRDEALAYLPYTDIFAIPSLNDGCPNALLEAMLAGKAIVGTNVDAIGEIIEDEVDGLLVNTASSKELTTALRRFINQPQLQKQFGLAAQAKVRSQLAPSIEQKNWQSIYQQLLGSSKVLEKMAV